MKINIKKLNETEKEWVFTVEIEGKTKTEHQVEVWKSDWQFLTGEEYPPEELVKRSFDFLLEKEPNDSILPVFNLMQINDYFPEFEDTIIGKL
jgi:hypothetical protein